MGSSANTVQPAGSGGAVVGGAVVAGGAVVVVAVALVSGGAAARDRAPDPAGLPISATISVTDSNASNAEPVPNTSPRRPGSSSQSTALPQSGTPSPVPARARVARPAAALAARPTNSPARPTVVGAR